MAQLLFKAKFREQLSILDSALAELQQCKVRYLLEHLPLGFTAAEAATFSRWERILIPVKDRGICIQLNRLCHGIPQLQFFLDADLDGIMGKPR